MPCRINSFSCRGEWRKAGEKGQEESEREVGREEPVGGTIEYRREKKTNEKAVGGTQVRMNRRKNGKGGRVKGWRRDGRVEGLNLAARAHKER